MKVSVSVSPLAGLPAPAGAHELAWSYLLDAVVADACAAGLGALHLDLPDAGLGEEARLRTAFGQAPAGPPRAGAALLGARAAPPPGAARLYTLEFGLLAPRGLRRGRQTGGWRLERQLSVFCLRARLWGLPIRAAALLGRPDLIDRAMFGMRRAFVRGQRRPAYYHLLVWSPA